jgi:glycosyltransferase involved in cell wall biosynthesis
MICVGRHYDPRKNVRMLLDAFGLAAMRDPRVPDLYLVGEPPTDAVRAQIEHSPVASRVHITGLQSDEELARLYRGARMLVVPSDEEGLGIVILEAMASGIPVISTRCGGPETAVMDGVTGYLTPKGDPVALCDAILRVASDSELCDHLGEEGLRRVQEMFSTEVVGAQFLNLYRGIAGGR